MELQWLMIVSWVTLGLGFASALLILVDEFLLATSFNIDKPLSSDGPCNP